MNINLEVIAYPPTYPRWQFWRTRRPYLLRKGIECHVDDLNGIATIFKPKNGYTYKMTNIIEMD